MAIHTHASRVLPARMASVAAAVATACASLVGLSVVVAPVGSNGSVGAATNAGPSWAGYFFPLKVGWTCHESLTGGGATGSETLTVSSVGTVPQGRSVTVTEGSSSTVGGTSVPTNAVLHYILSKTGQLITVPSGGQVAGQLYNDTGDTTDPSVNSTFFSAPADPDTGYNPTVNVTAGATAFVTHVAWRFSFTVRSLTADSL